MKIDNLDKLLMNYRFWSLAAIGSFIMFACLLLTLSFWEQANFALFLLVLLSGLLWIGITSISRHSFVLLKRYIGSEIGLMEFLSTQFIIFLFPFIYRQVKKEADSYRDKMSREKTVMGQ